MFLVFHGSDWITFCIPRSSFIFIHYCISLSGSSQLKHSRNHKHPPPKKKKTTEQVFGNIPGSFQISKHVQPEIGSGWNLKVNFGTKTLHLELGCVFLIFYVHPYILEEGSQPEPILTFADFSKRGWNSTTNQWPFTRGNLTRSL